ncbi:MAG: restriction endonuclease [Candidatus Nitrosotenuis sp.]
MAIPTGEELRLPILKLLEDGKPHTLKETVEKMIEHFKLSESERTQLIPSGTKGTFLTRVTWALSELRNATFLENIERGVFQITEKGRKAIKENPLKIDTKYLRQFAEYREFIGLTAKKADKAKPQEKTDDTPLEILVQSHRLLNNRLKKELLAEIKKMSPFAFEKLATDLVLKMGYGGPLKQGSVTKKTRDGGIDAIVIGDELGLDKIYLQMKKWQDAVGVGEIQKFVGALRGKKSRKGIFITRSYFRENVKNYLETIDDNVVLIDGDKLGDLMIEHNLGVISEQNYSIKRLDSGYFEEYS